jgi:hypothetical protein
MKIALLGELIEQDDGSAIAELDVDNEGKLYLMQLGFEALLMRGIETMKAERDDRR